MNGWFLGVESVKFCLEECFPVVESDFNCTRGFLATGKQAGH